VSVKFGGGEKLFATELALEFLRTVPFVYFRMILHMKLCFKYLATHITWVFLASFPGMDPSMHHVGLSVVTSFATKFTNAFSADLQMLGPYVKIHVVFSFGGILT
jgi:hypothetical protein